MSEQPATHAKDDRTREGHGEAEEAEREPPPGFFERGASWLSVLLIGLVIAFLIWEGLGSEDPPHFDVEITSVEAIGERYHVSLTVHNEGDVSAHNLTLRVDLLDGTEEIASSEVGVEWLPERSSRRAVALFDQDPGRYRIEVQPIGYELP